MCSEQNIVEVCEKSRKLVLHGVFFWGHPIHARLLTAVQVWRTNRCERINRQRRQDQPTRWPEMLYSFWRPSVVFTTLFVSWFYDGNECRTSLSPSRSAALAPYLFSAYTQFTHATTTTTVCLMPLASSAFVLAFSRSAINLPLVYIGL